MCGRYSLTTPVDSMAGLFGFDERPNLAARYNIAPTQDVLIVRIGESGAVQGVTVRWGLTPPWAKNLNDGVRMINARSETVQEKASFRGAYGSRRCLIPADGFYEWRKSETGKQPYRIAMRDSLAFAFAGIWETWCAPSGKKIETCAILTTVATPALTQIHHRMPVILDPGSYDLWMKGPPNAAAALMQPYESDALGAYSIGAAVGDVRNDGSKQLDLL